MKHLFGALGVAAAVILLGVSAAMNWRFGFQLGKTEFDGQIYGAASVASDILKALVPFFFFAAWRNRAWTQAIAACVVGLVCTGYSLTSALGHAALNRGDTTGQRVELSNSYKDLRADLKRAQDQLSWIPQHRPAITVQQDIEGLKAQRAWGATNGCTKIEGKTQRELCQQYHALGAEQASAQQGEKLEEKIADINGKLEKSGAHGAALASGDPQAEFFKSLTGVDTNKIQTALTVMVAILLEIGSGLGLFVATSQWRVIEGRAARISPVSVLKARPGANDNVSLPVVATAKLVAPQTDVERFYNERIENAEGTSLTATALYEDYCTWCEENKKEPMALPTFGRQFGELGVQKAKIAGRIRYIGIKLNSGHADEEDFRHLGPSVQAA